MTPPAGSGVRLADYAIPNRQLCHALTKLDNFAAKLVTKNDRGPIWKLIITYMYVGSAHARRENLQQDLALTGYGLENIAQLNMPDATGNLHQCLHFDTPCADVAAMILPAADMSAMSMCSSLECANFRLPGPNTTEGTPRSPL